MDLCSLCWGTKKPSGKLRGNPVYERPPDSPTNNLLKVDVLEKLAREQEAREEQQRCANAIVEAKTQGVNAKQNQSDMNRTFGAGEELTQRLEEECKLPNDTPSSRCIPHPTSPGYLLVDKDQLEAMFEKSRSYAAQIELNKLLLEKSESVEQRLFDVERLITELENTTKGTEKKSESSSTASEGFGPVEPNILGRKGSTLSQISDHSTGSESREHSFEECITIGKEAFSSQDFVQARRWFSRATKLASNVNDKRSMARAEANVSNALYQLGDYKSSLCHFERALQYVRDTGETTLECCLIPNGILVCIRLGELDQAMGLALRKLSIATTEQQREDANLWIEKTNKAIELQTPVSMDGQNVG